MQGSEPKNSTELESRIHRKGVCPVRWGGDRNLIWRQMKALVPYPTRMAQCASNSPDIAERLGMEVVLQEESYTSRTCPKCGQVRSKVRGRVFRCPTQRCRFVWHRDGVGAVNIWR